MARLLARSEHHATQRVRRRKRRVRPPRRGRQAPARRCGRGRRTCYRAGCRLQARNGLQAATRTGRELRRAKARRAATAGAPRTRGGHGPEPTVPRCRRAPRRTPMACGQARQARTNAGAPQAGQRRGMARLLARSERSATKQMRRRRGRVSPPRRGRQAPARRCERERRTCYRASCRLRVRYGPQAATETGRAPRQAMARRAATAGAPRA